MHLQNDPDRNGNKQFHTTITIFGTLIHLFSIFTQNFMQIDLYNLFIIILLFFFNIFCLRLQAWDHIKSTWDHYTLNLSVHSVAQSRRWHCWPWRRFVAFNGYRYMTPLAQNSHQIVTFSGCSCISYGLVRSRICLFTYL